MFKAINLDPDRYSSKALSILSKYMTVDNYHSSHNLPDIIKDYDIVILRFSQNMDAKLLSQATQLKLIACNATGVDHIDMDYAKQNNIHILSLQGETAFLDSIHATAELTWGLLLSAIRKIPTAHKHVAQQRWNRDLFLTRELHDKRIGILGFGRIGKKIANYAHAFGMRIYTYNSTAVSVPDYVTSCDSPEELASQADVLSIHINYNQANQGLVNHNILSRLPHGACVINTSRGAIIDEQALVDGLTKGHIASAGLDVLSGESNPGFLQNNPIIKYAQEHDNLVLTPHIGGVTHESWEKTEVFMAKKICEYLNLEKSVGGTT